MSSRRHTVTPSGVARTAGFRPALPRTVVMSLALLVALVLSGCGGSAVAVPEASAGKVTKLDSQQGRALLKSGRHTLLIDTRTVPEYIRGHLVGAQSVDMADEQAWEFRVAEFDKDRPTVVYCRDDGCSREAADRLVAAGLKQVYDLGSPDDWDQKYLPIEGRRSEG